MRGCDEEMCPNWSGDGRVCPCALFDLPRPSSEDHEEGEDVRRFVSQRWAEDWDSPEDAVWDQEVPR